MPVQNRSFLSDLHELFSSMRFAISLLTVLAIASVIGTVLKQNEPYPNYVIEFGQFWFGVFKPLGLFDVYHAWWFIAILFFLVLSTSLCLFRHTPLMLREMKSYREKATEESLGHFAHHVRGHTEKPTELLASMQQYLSGVGYRFKQKTHDNGDTLLAGKSGSVNRLGYVLTHIGIVVICIGGLIDGNLPLQIQQLFGHKHPETRDIPQSEVPAISRLSPANLSFRGDITIPEGATADVIFINAGEGYYVQDLPFSIHLKKFHIEHYPTGQPKMFASDVVVTDPKTGESVSQTITVNHPLIFRGVAIYQASFGDGGSHLHMSAWNLANPQLPPVKVDGDVKSALSFSENGQKYTLEFSDFRPFNIENFDDAPAKDSKMTVLGVLGAATGKHARNLRNTGPSFEYKVRNAEGVAREYNNYMLPVQIDKHWYMVSGMRTSPGEPYRYLHVPLDAENRLDGFMNLRALVNDENARKAIVAQFVAGALPGDASGEVLRAKLAESAEGVLRIFADGGFDAVAAFLEKNVPEKDREEAATIYLKILEQNVMIAYQMARQQHGKPPVAPSADTIQFVRDSLNAMSDLHYYGAPLYLQLDSFDQVQASGFQLTRSPGRNVVYGGSALLVLGVFAMFYIRERRLWLLVKKDGTTLLSMSCNRKTLDFEQEFERHKQALESRLRG